MDNLRAFLKSNIIQIKKYFGNSVELGSINIMLIL